MENNKKMTIWYVDAQINQMKDTVEFARTIEPKGEKRAREWALRNLDDLFERANGVLGFAQCYIECLNDDEQNELYKKLFRAYSDYKDQAYAL